MDDTYPFLEKLDWKEVFKLPFMITTEPYLQSYQYKILNRILNCNDRLFKWKIKARPGCDFCGRIDTIEHRLFYCKESKQIWDSIQRWIKTSLEIDTTFTICEVIFGIQINNDDYTDLMNYVILITKWYINKNKEQEKQLFFIELLSLFKNKLESITFMNTIKERADKGWQQLLLDLLY